MKLRIPVVTTGSTFTDSSARTWAAPSKLVGSISGLVVVLGFTVFHNVFIVDIWFNVGPMLFAGALCGFCIVWSYRKAVADHSTRAWFRYGGIYAAEMVALGAVSLAVLRPQFTMAELMVADDAFERLEQLRFGSTAGGEGRRSFRFWSPRSSWCFCWVISLRSSAWSSRRRR